MSPTHLHLMLNHVPALGIVFAGALLAIAVLRGNAALQRLALGFLLVFAVSAVPVYLTGEPAEDAVKRLGGVSREAIHRHEDAAQAAFIAIEVLGGLALVGLGIFRRAATVPRAVGVLLLAATVVTSALLGWTGYLGGQIRHPEIRADASAIAVASPGAVEGRRRRHDDRSR